MIFSIFPCMCSDYSHQCHRMMIDAATFCHFSFSVSFCDIYFVPIVEEVRLYGKHRFGRF